METFEQLMPTLYQSISSSALLPVITAEKNNSGANFTIMSKATKTDFTYKIHVLNLKEHGTLTFQLKLNIWSSNIWVHISKVEFTVKVVKLPHLLQ